jgi:hypothetical protein
MLMDARGRLHERAFKAELRRGKAQSVLLRGRNRHESTLRPVAAGHSRGVCKRRCVLPSVCY